MKSLPSLLALVSFVVANHVPQSDLVLHEQLSDVPDSFTHSGAAPPDQVLNLRISLVSNNIAGLEERLYAVSEPSSSESWLYLRALWVEEFVRPADETVQLVNGWLHSNGIPGAESISSAGDWLAVSMPVSKVNEILDAEFSVFTNINTGNQVVRTLSYSIPASLKGHLDFVHPTITFASVSLINPTFQSAVVHRRASPGVTPPASCSDTVTPDCILDLYNVSTTPATQQSNVLGVSGFIGQFPNDADLSQFLSQFRTDISSSTVFSLLEVDDGQDPQNPRKDAGIEANLDTQYTVGVAAGVPVTFVSVGSNNTDDLDGFIDIITNLTGMVTPPAVLTTSYGFNENEISASLANKLCNAHMQLGARGTSILFSSGDGGVSGSQAQNCRTFIPTFPSGCTFTTSVGATQGIPETAASFSSGGFSNIFGAPSYQATARSTFLAKLGRTNSGKFNTSGRGFPDVAALGVNFEIVVDAETGLVNGTSCSSPIFASIIALLNDRLISVGKPTLGFLNPFLYSTGAAALNDITTGNNPGCSTEGFTATTGWDPITGLGTPNFPALRQAVGL